MREKNERRPIPFWYLYTILGLIIFSFVFNIIVTTIPVSNHLFALNLLAVTITIIWFFINLILLVIFLTGHYEWKAIVFSSYFIVLQVWNLSNVFFQYYTDYVVLFWISMCTKMLETIIVVTILKSSGRWPFGRVCTKS